MPGTSYSEHFTNLNSFNFHVDPIRWVYYYPCFTEEETETQKGLSSLPMVTQLLEVASI